MKRTVRFIAVMVTILCVVSAGQVFASGSGQAGGAASASGALPVLRVAVIPVVSSLPIQYITDMGWDVENGFRIEKVVFSSGAPMGEALVSNLWDIGIMSAAGVFAAANYDAMCIADTSDSIGYRGIGIFARPNSPVAAVQGAVPAYPALYGDAASVRGKTILCPTGTLSQMQVGKWLEQLGLKETDVSRVHMEYAQAYQAFLSGQGDLVALNPPFCFTILDSGVVDVAPTDVLGVKLHDMVFANKRTYSANREIIKKCLELIYRAGEELDADPAKKIAALDNWYKVNGSTVAPDVLAMEAGKKLFTLTDIRGMNGQIGGTLVSTAEFFASLGNIEADKLPVVRSNINDELIRELLR